MHNIKRVILKEGIGLTCVKSNRSKTSCLSAMLLLPLGAESRSSAALLPYILRSSCRDYAGKFAVAAKLDDLYGARLEPIVRKRGEAQMVGFVADVIDDRYALEGMNHLFTGTADLMTSMLLHPSTFDRTVLKRETDMLCARIAALPDDKRLWAVRRMYQLMCADEAYSLTEFGDIDVLRELTPDRLMQQYQDMMQHAPAELFYCGSLDAEAVAEQLNEAVQDWNITDPIRPVFHTPCTPAGDLRMITEQESVAQGKLTIGLRTGITAFDDDYPAMVLFNSCFGGSTSSRLFRTVREEMSLCYYASTQTDKLKGVMAVASGIENASEQQAREEILHQLDELQHGATEEEVNAARRSVIGSLRGMKDSPLALENFYQTQSAAGITDSLDELISRIAHVTAEDVTRAAQKAVPDTVYFLKGADV